MDKLGMDTGLKAIHPITGEALWVANFVLMSYGSGAVMSVPAHDQRDFEFALKYGLPIKQVIQPTDGELPDQLEAAFVEKGVLVNSGEFTALTSQEAFVAIAEYLEGRARGVNATFVKGRHAGMPLPNPTYSGVVGANLRVRPGLT